MTLLYLSNGFLILSKNIHMQSNVLIFIGMSTTVGTSKGWGKWWEEEQ